MNYFVAAQTDIGLKKACNPIGFYTNTVNMRMFGMKTILELIWEIF